jgi:hypothetical protein
MLSTPPRNCPRCRGAMIMERDWYGAYGTCLSCGFVHEVLTSPPIEIPDDVPGPGRQRRREPSHGRLRL